MLEGVVSKGHSPTVYSLAMMCVGREHWQTLDSSKDIESIWKHDIEPTNSIGDCTRLQKYV